MSFYKMIINNLATYISSQKDYSESNVSAFTASEILAIALAKDSREILCDLAMAGLEKNEKKDKDDQINDL